MDSAVKEYKQIGMDSEYARCIQEFASVETTGQMNSGQSGASSVGSPLGSLLGSFLSSGMVDGVSPSSFDLLSSGNTQNAETYVQQNTLDASQLVWTKDSGSYKLKLSEAQWRLVQDLDLNVFYDDGEGYIDLGLDNIFSYDKYGNLIGDYDGTWLSIDGQIVAYYHLDTVEEGSHYSITGYVPVILNGNRAELILVFDDARPDGYIAGARDVYTGGQTQTQPKNLTEVKAGDRLEFICDYYSYNGTYRDSYYLGEPMIYSGNARIGNLDIDGGSVQVMYRLTDIYNQYYWTPVLPE